MEVLCNECSSPMELVDELWQCNNCLNVLLPTDVDDTLIEEGLSMKDVMRMYQERDEDRKGA